MTEFRSGLVVGKFCPLHRGHQLVLDEAARRCERLYVLSYTKPEFEGFGPGRRERWLAALYPDAVRLVLDDVRLAEICRARQVALARLPGNDEGDDVHRMFVAWVLHEVLGTDIDAVFTSESYGDGFAMSLSDAQQRRGWAPAVHVLVDLDRGVVPVSGTAIRRDLHGHREWLHPRVYRDFVSRVAILGGESTGKSTLASTLAARLGTVFAAEYGRELWDEKAGALQASDMLHIARTQVGREEALLERAHRFLLCDTTPLTTLLYSQAMFGSAADDLAELARRHYDLTFLCEPDVPFIQDGTRRDAAFRQWQHDWYLRELASRGLDCIRLQGPWDQRLETAMALLTAA